VPTSISDIQSFFGLAGYYRRFIKGFLKISKLMTELLEKDKKFKWMLACEACFQELKKRLMTDWSDISDARYGEVILYLL
jgi:hypothetical protein